MKRITLNTELIIGINFGYREASATCYYLRTQENKELDILQGRKVILSAVAILEQEGKQTICVGGAAVEYAPYAKDFQISFKKRPSEMNDVERKRMESFMKGVYAGILDRHPDYKTREHVVCLIYPLQGSQNKSEVQALLRIAEDAGLPIVGIQKKSTATYFRALTEPDSPIDSQAGVLIVDFGYSTINFTYHNNMISVPIDDVCPLGTSEVEKTLLEYAMANPSDDFMPEFTRLYGSNKDSDPYNRMLYTFREAIENFCSNKLSIFHVVFDYSLIIALGNSPIIGFGGTSIPKDKLDSLLCGYIKRVKEAVVAFKTEKLKDHKDTCVYLDR